MVVFALLMVYAATAAFELCRLLLGRKVRPPDKQQKMSHINQNPINPKPYDEMISIKGTQTQNPTSE